MKKIISFYKAHLILTVLHCTTSLIAQQPNETRSTKDLSFLIGKWNVERIYNPNNDNERILDGTLICEESLDGKFIKCRYEINRPEKIRGLDEVFFNYNPIYNMYESIWMSSTWPIKVLMQGTLQHNTDNIILNTTAHFQIENSVTEYVKDELIIGTKGEDLNSFTRKTYIRTSEYEDDDWHHHMTEIATRIDR
ncbi:DUF1579 family protein [Flagellimonas sp. S3867]|uniref:DUF1579 family protein n=1 Tax=Flagellimonas sp. S3867 TaxID=2768063 RepID=UPI001682D650|nr:DUF1579 family protein [Flagellimonas sp. S3867]